MQKAHCPKCAGYESRVMRRKDGEELPPDVVPCEAFVMSDRFKEWAVGEMRKEMGGQIGAAGLDRMAILKAKGRPTHASPAASQDVAPAAAAPAIAAPATSQAMAPVNVLREPEAAPRAKRERANERPPVGFREFRDA